VAADLKYFHLYISYSRRTLMLQPLLMRGSLEIERRGGGDQRTLSPFLTWPSHPTLALGVN